MAATNHTPKARGSKPAKDPIIDSLHYPLVISFGASRAAGYETALMHARLVKEYSEYGEGNTVRHYCRIAKTREEFARAAAIIDCLRTVKSLSVYVNGSPVRNLNELTNVLNCYLQAEACNDYTAHCHVVEEEYVPYYSRSFLSVDLEDEPRTGPPRVIPRHLFPCALLRSRYHLQNGHPSSTEDQIQAAGVKYGCNICLRFRPEDYREIAPRVVHADGTVE